MNYDTYSPCNALLLVKVLNQEVKDLAETTAVYITNLAPPNGGYPYLIDAIYEAMS